MGKIVFIGHSVVKGTDYGSVTAADTFARKIGLANGYVAADIINSGVGSDTSAGMLARVQSAVIAYAPSVCAVMIGVNDWSTSVPVASFKSNLSAFVDAVKGAGIKCVLFTDNVNRGTAAQFGAYYPYIEAIKEVALVKNCRVVDLYGAMSQRMLVGDHASLYVDSIHLTVTGHQFVADHAAKPYYAGFFVPDSVPAPDPQPQPNADLQPLVTAMANHLLQAAHPNLTAQIATELGKL